MATGKRWIKLQMLSVGVWVKDLCADNTVVTCTLPVMKVVEFSVIHSIIIIGCLDDPANVQH